MPLPQTTGRGAGPLGDPKRLSRWLAWTCLIAAGLLIPEAVGVVAAWHLGRTRPAPAASPAAPADSGAGSVATGPAAPSPTASEPNDDEAGTTPSRPPAPPRRAPEPPPEIGGRPPPPPSPKRPDPSPPAGWLPAVEQDKVNKAIVRGVEFLKKAQNAEGRWTASDQVVDRFPVGLAALPGLTLLECGEPPDEAHVQKAAAFVRKGAPECGQTYELALGILFLDRLGDPADRPLIRSMALRLVAGQTALGGWTYGCPVLAPQEEADLAAALQTARPGAPEKKKGGADALPRGAAADDADHSNTQFAVLGLWAARRARRAG
jgi:hypothetical protein